jgi:hypothetical protein
VHATEMMSDDKLFRWNFTLPLACEVCRGACFVEEVSSCEIFCAMCGKPLIHVRDVGQS